MSNTLISIDPTSPVAPVRRRLFGAFVEHLGRCVYGGIYDPEHPTATEEGFRGDVMELVRELGTTTIRYPGGNFVSGYNWEDGIGPRENRPVRLNPAWHSVETNQVGLDEFGAWCRAVGQEMMLAVNLGTRGVADALNLLEYVNHPGGTTLSEARIANGSPEPYGVKMWCLGNEMDGPWQLGYMTAEEYASVACRTAAAMRQLQPDLELVVCGSSGSEMPTFGEWERIVLERCYDVVDFVSCHAYYQIKDGDLGTFLASPLNLERYVDTTIAVADYIKGRKGSNKTINISLDEWNVWYQAEQSEAASDVEAWPAAPARIEDNYTLADAVVVGSLLITILKRAGRIHSASLAQLVNAIAPIRTETGGPAWRQSTFFPFALTSRLAQGVVLPVRVECGTYANATYGEVPLVDAVATHDQATGRGALFLVNRDLAEANQVAVDVSWLGEAALLETATLAGDDPFAINTAAEPDRVCPATNPTVRLDSNQMLRLTLPPLSWTAVALGSC